MAELLCTSAQKANYAPRNATNAIPYNESFVLYISTGDNPAWVRHFQLLCPAL